ncbi:hypothetical protein COLO4_11264 [Corchorus olitorius]|uniref:Uncharacterized protein n=1 Tax=Corchorus olitorius TaxID=93759 RepID=A0A1R3K5H2_9ROSI|nr:hypothetical protein COLO4_11264 [Corchorus olitorius]
MPRSSRHKSSKHSSRDARDYSDSERDSGLKEKEKKSKEESSVRVSKESGSGEKRKLDSKETSKELWSSGNGEYVEEYSSSKRRKDKTDDGVSDRWNGELDIHDRLQSPESESQLERRLRKRRDGSGDGDKHQEDNGNILDRQVSSRNDTGKDGRAKDEKYKDDRYRDKYREDMDREDKYRDDKQRDERPARDHANSKSSEKHVRDEKDAAEIRQKNSRYKDSRGRKRSPDDRDDSIDIKSRGTKAHYSDMENKSLTSSRVEVDADRGRSQSRQANADATMGSNKRRASPSSSSHIGIDEYRHSKEDPKYRESMTEQRSKAVSSRDVSFSGASERGNKYRSMEKSSRADEGHSGELPIERSSSSKASPMGMMERSPSSTSLERRYMNRSGVRRSLDIEETGWRSNASIGGRELSATEDRLSRDLPPEKPLLDESSQADSAFYNRAGQGNSSLIPQPPGYRAGIGSPSFMGSLEDDNNRINIGGRYKRSGDMNAGRGQANAWRGAPNWPSPVPNGFIPFQHGPPHGGFQAMMPQFPSPSLFGVRPSIEINHAGIPYHIADAERFSNHLRPIGWQNMMDGSGPAHLHGWDGNSVVFRDEAHMYGGPEWDQSRHPMNGRGWDTSSDVWKGQNGDVELPATSQKEDHPVQAPLDDIDDGQEHKRSQHENSHSVGQVKSLETRSNVMSPAKESSRSLPKITHEKAPDSTKNSSDDGGAHYCQVYLSKLDISTELAGSELYDQCMSLMNVEQSKDLVRDVTMLVNLKNGGRAVQKASIAVLNPSLIPATNASVFQKAMDLYKKQRLQVGTMVNVSSGMLTFISADNQEKGKEQSSDHAVEEAKEPALNSDLEMLDAAMPTSGQQKAEVATPASLENSEQIVSIPSGELPDHMDSLPLEKSELPNTEIGESSPELPKPVLNGNEAAEEMESEQMISEDAVGDSLQPPDNASDAVVSAPTGGEILNEINKNEGDEPVTCEQEREVFGDAISGSLIFSDGSPKVSGALIPGSNESESVILSRIHHSPENTH